MTALNVSFWRELLSRLSGPWPRLRFEADVEQRFWQATAVARMRHFVRSGVVALIIYNGFLVVDWSMTPDTFEFALWVRLACFTPLALLVLVLGARLASSAQRLPPHLPEWVVVATGVGAAFTLDLILTATASPLSVLYRAGFVPVLVYGNVVQRLRWRGALVLSASVIGIYVLSVLTARVQSGELQPLMWPLTLLVVAIAAYTLASNYRMEYVERQRFLASERTHELSRQLQHSHQQLEAQARGDALTGVANRRHFDSYLEACWTRESAGGGQLALLLLDIDHFKAFNDRYGHPAGDECLRHVARALQGQVPESLGLLARWGGEEFAVVLPGFDAHDAASIGLALRDAIHALGLRHAASPTAPAVTISAGVASVSPASYPFGPAQLVEAADAALYRAKHAGRNRVEQAEASEAVWA